MLFYPVDTSMSVVCSIEVSIGQKILHFRSIVQVKYVFLTVTNSFDDLIIFCNYLIFNFDFDYKREKKSQKQFYSKLGYSIYFTVYQCYWQTHSRFRFEILDYQSNDLCLVNVYWHLILLNIWSSIQTEKSSH